MQVTEWQVVQSDVAARPWVLEIRIGEDRWVQVGSYRRRWLAHFAAKRSTRMISRNVRRASSLRDDLAYRWEQQDLY